MTAPQQQAPFENTARELSNVSEPIRRLHIEHCAKADPAYGAGVSRAIHQIIHGNVPSMDR
ncbi:catalase-related domain-containing protein [Paraburkholderia mimosarum]|uniref:catalase-related domain-containing protein n=1 Tax=Paraburkholderia mimosarum TaxID=312026 RepID=UPI0039C27135